MFAPEKSNVATSIGRFKFTILAATKPEFPSKYTESLVVGISPDATPPDEKDQFDVDDQEPLPPIQYNEPALAKYAVNNRTRNKMRFILPILVAKISANIN
jgi:hypothetical protein